MEVRILEKINIMRGKGYRHVDRILICKTWKNTQDWTKRTRYAFTPSFICWNILIVIDKVINYRFITTTN